jgi:hypothetical protein
MRSLFKAYVKILFLLMSWLLLAVISTALPLLCFHKFGYGFAVMSVVGIIALVICPVILFIERNCKDE